MGNGKCGSYLSNTRARLLLITQLLMRRRPRMNSQRLRISHIRQIRNQLEVIHNLASRRASTLNTERKYTPKSPWQIFLRKLMGRMALESWIAHPAHILIRFEPLCQFQRIERMPLAA
jgi:hypothetical protein